MTLPEVIVTLNCLKTCTQEFELACGAPPDPEKMLSTLCNRLSPALVYDLMVLTKYSGEVLSIVPLRCWDCVWAYKVKFISLVIIA